MNDDDCYCDAFITPACVWCCARAVLEDLAHGPGPVCSAVCSHDSSQHLPGGFRLQECQIRPQAQVRMPISFLSLSLGFCKLN